MTAVVVLVALAGVLIGFCAVVYRSARREVTDYAPKPATITFTANTTRFSESARRAFAESARARREFRRQQDTPLYFDLRDEYHRDGKRLAGWLP